MLIKVIHSIFRRGISYFYHFNSFFHVYTGFDNVGYGDLQVFNTMTMENRNWQNEKKKKKAKI